MYISRVEIDLNNRQKIRDLTHLGAYHNWVEQSFPDENSKKIRSRKLWRIDYLFGKSYLLIVSNSKPDLKALEKYGVDKTGQTKDYDKFLDSLQEGQTMRFRVCLNPVVAKSEDKNSKRGRLYPCYKIEDQSSFLKSRSLKNGFEINNEDFSIVERSHKLLKKKGMKNIRLNQVTYEGKLKIIDIDKFKKILTQGMGREKAYGFGMMTVIEE